MADPMGMTPEVDPLDPQQQYMNPMHALWAGLLMDVGNIFGPNRQAQGLAPQLMLSVMSHNRQLAAQQQAAQEARFRTLMLGGEGGRVQSVKEVISPDGKVNLLAVFRDGSTRLLNDAEGNPMEAPIPWRYLEGPAGSVTGVPGVGAGGGIGGISGQQVISREQALDEAVAGQKATAATTAEIGLPEKIAQAEIQIGNVDRVIAAIEQTRQKVGPWTTGWGSLFRIMPESEARALSREILRLKSNTFLDALGELRMMGGTVGQVTEREGEKIEGKWAALDQAGTEEALNAALDDLVDQYRRSADNVMRVLEAEKQKARGEFSGPRRRYYNPETGKLE